MHVRLIRLGSNRPRSTKYHGGHIRAMKVGGMGAQVRRIRELWTPTDKMNYIHYLL